MKDSNPFHAKGTTQTQEIFYTLAPAKKQNQGLTRPFGTMQVEYHFFTFPKEGTKGDLPQRESHPVEEKHRKLWGLSPEEVHQAAGENTPRLFPMRMELLRDVILEACNGGNPQGPKKEDFQEEVPVYLLTNSYGWRGAGVILYPHILRELGAWRQENYMLIPASIHEMLLLYEGEGYTKDDLEEILHQVNETQVLPQEVLSSSVLTYDWKEEILLQKGEILKEKGEYF